MKYLLSIFFIIIFAAQWVAGQTLEEKEKAMVQKNHIKTISQLDFKYVNGVAVKEGIKISVTTFNTKGDIVQKKILSSKGETVGLEEYEYDINGNRTFYNRNSSSGNYNKRSQYDEKNNLLVEVGFNGADNFKNIFTYLPNGQTNQIVYMVNNRIEDKHVYDNKGNISLIGIYAGGVSLSSKLKLVYDTKKNVIEETVISIDNRELEKKVFKYNAASQIIEEEKTKNGGFYYRTNYSYDAAGNLLSISEETLSQKKYVKKSYVYDSAGNLKEYRWRRSADEDFNLKSYTFNAKGICLSEYTLYPKTKFELLTKYEYEF